METNAIAAGTILRFLLALYTEGNRDDVETQTKQVPAWAIRATAVMIGICLLFALLVIYFTELSFVLQTLILSLFVIICFVSVRFLQNIKSLFIWLLSVALYHFFCFLFARAMFIFWKYGGISDCCDGQLFRLVVHRLAFFTYVFCHFGRGRHRSSFSFIFHLKNLHTGLFLYGNLKYNKIVCNVFILKTCFIT